MPHKITSRSYWLPLNSIIRRLAEFVSGDYTPSLSLAKFATEPKDRSILLTKQ